LFPSEVGLIIALVGKKSNYTEQNLCQVLMVEREEVEKVKLFNLLMGQEESPGQIKVTDKAGISSRP
jgi:hypothetical protein